MSDSESDEVQFDDSGSDDFDVVPKLKKAPQKKSMAATFTAVKVVKVSFSSGRPIPVPQKRTETVVMLMLNSPIQPPAAGKSVKKKAPLSSKNAPNDSISEADETDLAASPAKPKQKSKLAGDVMDVDGEENVPEGSQKAGGAKSKTASEMYQKVCSILQAM